MRESGECRRAFLVAAPLWFNINFVLLAKAVHYPEILRRPTPEILDRFRRGGPGLILLWWTFMISAVLLIVSAILLGLVLGVDGLVGVATVFGVIAGVVQMLGLLRWVYLVPMLARVDGDTTLDPAQREVNAATSVPNTNTSGWASASTSVTCSQVSGPF